MGYRAYAAKELTEIFDLQGYIADGSVTAGGSITAGAASLGVLEKSGRVLDFGSFERTISPRKDNLLASYEAKQRQHMTVTLDNADRYFARLIAKEPFLGRPIWAYVGFEDEPQVNHQRRFSGVIGEISVLPRITIEADER